jgi:hypothetical protein
VRNRTERRSPLVALPAVLFAVVALATACSQGAAKPATHHMAAPPTAPATVPPVPPHGGVNLNVLVVTDGTPPVESIRQELVAEQVPSTVVNLHARRRPVISRAFLARTNPDGTTGGNFDGVVLPGPSPAGLSAAENAALIWYEQSFHVREVDAYSPPMPDMGMISPPAYSGPLTGTMGVTSAGARAGFGYLKAAFPFSGGPAGPAPFGYLAQPQPGAGATPLITSAIPHSSGSAALVWQYDHGGRQQLGIGFGYGYFQPQFHYLGNGIVSWVTRGVNLGDWRNYLDIAYDDMFLGDAQWSIKYHCTPGITACPKAVTTPGIRMVPADVTYAVQWEEQHHFTIEWLFNGGASARFAVHGVDALLVATRPVAKDFYWVNHTWTHAWMGCVQDFSVTPWKCVTSGGHLVWAADTSFVNTQFLQNFAWAKQNGIPVERDAVAPGEYTGLRILPQQPVDNPYMDAAMGPDHIEWVAMDASREPDMRPVGAALGVPRHPIDVGEDVDTVAEEVSEFNWYNDSKADGGGGFCQGSKVTQCLKPLSLRTGWTSFILPSQVQLVFQALLNNDPRPFFMHQSNMTGDRLGYPVMDGILSAYNAVYGPSAPIANLPMDQDGVVLRNQQLWSQDARTVTAWVQGHTLTISGPRGATVPVTVPEGSRAGSPAGPAFGSPYAGERSEYTQLGSQPLQIDLGSDPY